MEERNEILLQTGIIDTTDERQPTKTAIIRLDDKDVFLAFEKSYISNNQINEVYKGAECNLVLSFNVTANKYSQPIYSGKFTIEKNNNYKEEITVVGRSCNL